MVKFKSIFYIWELLCIGNEVDSYYYYKISD